MTDPKTTEASRFHLSEQIGTITDGAGVQHQIGSGWVVMTEAEYARLRAEPQSSHGVLKHVARCISDMRLGEEYSSEDIAVELLDRGLLATQAKTERDE